MVAGLGVCVWLFDGFGGLVSLFVFGCCVALFWVFAVVLTVVWGFMWAMCFCVGPFWGWACCG